MFKATKFVKKLNIELSYDPTISLLDICPEKTIIRKNTGTPESTAMLCIIAKTWKKPKCP